MTRCFQLIDLTGLKIARQLRRRLGKLTASVFLAGALASPAFGQQPPAVGQPSQTVSGLMSFNALRSQIAQDLANQREMLLGRRTDLIRWDAAAQQAFAAAFGTTDPAARQQVVNCIDRELQMNARLSPDNFRQTNRPGYYAHVYSNDPATIYLDGAYATAPATGPNSRAGTLVHEMSHFDNVCRTRDYMYGQSDSAVLADGWSRGLSPFRPWQNADNVEYYVEGALGPSSSRTPTPSVQPGVSFDESAPNPPVPNTPNQPVAPRPQSANSAPPIARHRRTTALPRRSPTTKTPLPTTTWGSLARPSFPPVTWDSLPRPSEPRHLARTAPIRPTAAPNRSVLRAIGRRLGKTGLIRPTAARDRWAGPPAAPAAWRGERRDGVRLQRSGGQPAGAGRDAPRLGHRPPNRRH